MILFLKRKKINSPFAGYLCNLPQAPFVGYPSEFGVPGYSCGSIVTFKASGEGYLYPGIWVAI
jgi:hypothetical protein